MIRCVLQNKVPLQIELLQYSNNKETPQQQVEMQQNEERTLFQKTESGHFFVVAGTQDNLTQQYLIE